MIMEPNKSSVVYIQNVLEAVEKIEKFVEGMVFKDFSRSKLTVDAVSHCFVVVGETIRNMPSSARLMLPKTSLQKFVRMSDELVHEYFNVTDKWLWRAIQDDMPRLKRLMQEVKV